MSQGDQDFSNFEQAISRHFEALAELVDRLITLIDQQRIVHSTLDRIEGHLYHIERHCRPEQDESEGEPKPKERTL